MSTHQEPSKEELLNKIKTIDEEFEKKKESLLADLKKIEEKETDEAIFHEIVPVLDAGDVLLSITKHTRDGCSDDNPINGRRYVRCDKCDFIGILSEWKQNREWLIETKSGKEILKHFKIDHLDIEFNIGTFY